ncbi:MAG: hypothetical protein LIO80_07325 [Lachnospiraceae bacterium]|nr:hypothetical protein [Lachnospiraceae bacterium]
MGKARKISPEVIRKEWTKEGFAPEEGSSGGAQGFVSVEDMVSELIESLRNACFQG